MTDKFGLLHRMEVEEICLKESEMTPEQLKKREMATRRRLRGQLLWNFVAYLKVLRDKPWKKQKVQTMLTCLRFEAASLQKRMPLGLKGSMKSIFWSSRTTTRLLWLIGKAVSKLYGTKVLIEQLSLLTYSKGTHLDSKLIAEVMVPLVSVPTMAQS